MSQTINWKHGFLRLWVVVSILWLGTVSTFVVLDHSWQEPPPHTDDPSTDPSTGHDICVYRDAQGVMHFTTCPPDAQARGFVPFNLLSPEDKGEQEQTGDELLAQEKKQSLWKHRRELITQALPFAFGPPLTLLLCGVTVSWIIRGFTAR